VDLSRLGVVMGGLLLSGCDASFGVSRQELGPFRIAALGVHDGIAEAAIWSGDGLFHEEAPVLSWSLDGEPLGLGFGIEVPGPGILELEATSPDGDVRRAEVTVADLPAELALMRAEVDLRQSGLDREDREALEAEGVDAVVASGLAARLELGEPGGESLEAGLVRWMRADGAGTLLELTERSADFLAEDVVFEDGEVISRERLDDGLYSLLALHLGGEGANRWLWIDVAMGDEGPWWRHEGRLLPGEVSAETGLVAGTVVEAEGPSGVILEDLASVESLDEMLPIACAPTETPFRLAWVAEGRCPRPEVLGSRVVVSTW